MNTHCPVCHGPVAVAVNAREGRCRLCKPRRKRRHSQPRPTNYSSNFAEFLAQHNGGWV